MPVVYALIAASNPTEMRYIGRSENDNPEGRRKDHLNEASKGSNTYKCNVLRKILRSGDEVLAIVIESNLSWKDSGIREAYWIDYYKALGHRLTNMTNGGDGVSGYKHTEESKKKFSRKGRVVSNETRKKISIGNTGKVVSEEAKRKISIARTGKVMSEEAKAKRKSTIQQPWSKERRLAYGKIRTGEKRSEETKQRLRENKLKYWEQKRKAA